MDIQHLRLPYELRAELARPMGELIPGSPEHVAPLLAERFRNYRGFLVTVGDVVSQMLLDEGVEPHLIITDGMTKRTAVGTKLENDNYDEVLTKSAAAEISEEAWGTLRYIVEQMTEDSRYHLIVEGEEDLLVLPLYVEMGDREFMVIYGQPNEGAVVIEGNLSKRFLIEDIIDRMETVSDEHRDN